VVPTIQRIALEEMDIEQEYVQIIDYTYEITKALKSITSESFKHIDNNHTGFNEQQAEDLQRMSKNVSDMYNAFINMMERHDYSSFDTLLKYRDNMLDLYAKLTKRQIKRVKNMESGTRTSILFLNILNETKNIVLQSINMMRAQRDMILTNNQKNTQYL
jgi:Na+/phosphate symporter